MGRRLLRLRRALLLRRDRRLRSRLPRRRHRRGRLGRLYELFLLGLVGRGVLVRVFAGGGGRVEDVVVGEIDDDVFGEIDDGDDDDDIHTRSGALVLGFLIVKVFRVRLFVPAARGKMSADVFVRLWTIAAVMDASVQSCSLDEAT